MRRGMGFLAALLAATTGPGQTPGLRAGCGARGAGRGEWAEMRRAIGFLAVLLAATTVRVQTPDLRERVRADVAQHEKQIVGELLQLLAIPNVAADKPNIRRNATHLQQ